MTKLEETLELIDSLKVPEKTGHLLQDKVKSLLEDNGYSYLNKNSGITYYGRERGRLELFIEYNPHEYCFAAIDEQLRCRREEFYNRFKAVHAAFAGELLTFFASFTGIGAGIVYLARSIGVESENEASMIALGTLIFSGLGGWYLANQFHKHKKNKLKKSCEEIYYGKEALKKAFRRW